MREQRLESERHVRHDRVARGRACGLLGIVRDQHERRRLRQHRARDVRVVGEHRRAEHEHQVVWLQGLGQRPDRRRQQALEVGMVLRKPDAPRAGGGRRPHGQPAPLGQRDGRVPATSGVDIGAGDQHRVRRTREPARKILQRGRVGGGPARGRPPGHLARRHLVGLGRPVVHRDGDEHRPERGELREVVCAGQRRRHVLRSRRLVAPLHERPRQHDRVGVGEQGLHGHHRAYLLTGRDHQRGLVLLRVEDRAHRIAHAGRGVQIDQRRPPRGLGIPVRHPHHDRLLEAEHVAEVVREPGQERKLGGAGVAEHGRQPVRAQQIV